MRFLVTYIPHSDWAGFLQLEPPHKSFQGAFSKASTAKSQISFADWELLQQGIELEPVLQSISDFPRPR